jgi:hypothetical protein
MERAVADLPTYKAGDLLTLKCDSLIKAGGSALVKLLLKLVNWVWELETLPSVVAGVIVNLFKAGDTQLPGITGGPVQSAARCLQTCCASASGPKCTCTRLRRRSEAKIHRQLVRAHASSRGWQANKTVYAFWTCAKRMVWRMGYP